MAEETNENDNTDIFDDLEKEPEVYYKPVVELKPVKVITHEEDEEELVRLRCKLYRYAYDSEDVEWKERGIGDIKMLKHPESGRIRIVMRREKVFTVCCNHYLKPIMQLSRAAGTTSDRAVVWSTLSDFADGDAKRETFAARFQTPEIADSFREKWNELTGKMKKSDDNVEKEGAQSAKSEPPKEKEKEEKPTEAITEALDKMNLKNEEGSLNKKE